MGGLQACYRRQGELFYKVINTTYPTSSLYKAGLNSESLDGLTNAHTARCEKGNFIVPLSIPLNRKVVRIHYSLFAVCHKFTYLNGYVLCVQPGTF